MTAVSGSAGWVVPEAGLEPARFLGRGILNPLCLPISPLRHGVAGVKSGPAASARLYQGVVRAQYFSLTSLPFACKIRASARAGRARTVARYTIAYIPPPGDLSTCQGEKSMAMKLVKKTAEYSIYKRSDERYAIKDADKQPVNGDEKVKILVAEGLIRVSVPAEPAEEPVAEEVEEAAVEDADAEDATEADAQTSAEAEEDAIRRTARRGQRPCDGNAA